MFLNSKETLLLNKEFFSRALNELNAEDVEAVLDLIDQNSLYRGEEHRFVLERFLKHKKEYDEFNYHQEQNHYTWDKVMELPDSILHIRNSVIGSLLVDLSEGSTLDKAVCAFEKKVAPVNYKRPKPAFTKKQLENAKKKLQEMGYMNSLERRYATERDITVNNVLFIDRETLKRVDKDVFDLLEKKIKKSPKTLKKVEEVTLDHFLQTILPNVDSLELKFENKNLSNLVSLIAPVNVNACSKTMFKWDNNFSWAYSGDITDSNIKEKVKAAGGNVDADLRFSLSWFNGDDLDLHLYGPRIHVGFENKYSPKIEAHLDVDMNARGIDSREPVENIYIKDQSCLVEGKYTVVVHNYNKREKKMLGLTLK